MLELTVVEGEWRIDSRLIAQGINVQHKALLQLLKKYPGIEKYGVLPFQMAKPQGNRGGRPERYALLNKEQCGYILMFVRVNEVVRSYRERVYDTFLAYEHAQRQDGSAINEIWRLREALNDTLDQMPKGYWSIFREILPHFYRLARKGVILTREATPDISIGILFNKYLRAQAYDMSLIREYPHIYPDKRGVQLVKIYPNDLLPLFRNWFEQVYLKEHFPRYLASRQVSSDNRGQDEAAEQKQISKQKRENRSWREKQAAGKPPAGAERSPRNLLLHLPEE